MNIPKIAEAFEKFVKNEAIVAVGTSEYDSVFLDELIKLILISKKKIYFVPTTSKQATQLHSLGQSVISLSDKEIDDATTGAKVRWFEYYDSNHNLKKKSLISDFPSGDVTKTIFNGKGEIKKIIILPKDILKEFEIDVDKRIKQTKRK